MTAKHLTTFLATAIVAASLSASAFAGGEPKNEWPFTRPVADRAPAQVVQAKSAPTEIRGEPKNQPPFTTPVVQGTTIVATSGRGFSWLDGAIGAAAGVGLVFVGLGSVLLARTTRRVGGAAEAH
jgi:hypothetical protein